MGCGKMMNTKTVKQRIGTGTWHSMFVLISCCLITVLHIGILYSVGTLFRDVMTAFNSTRAETAVIQSVTIGVNLFLGIFIGAFINKVGLMTVGMLGSLVASVGLMACFFASSLTYLIISMGVVSGFGFSCVYISSVAVISQHFSGRKKLLCLSMHASGSGIGGMLYPYLIRYLSDRYGFRGALLLIGGICLNTVAGCFLWKEHTNTIEQRLHFTNQIDEFQRRLQVKTEKSGEIIIIEKLEQGPSTKTFDSVFVSQYPVLQDKNETKTVVVQAFWNNLTASNKSKAGQTLCEHIRQILHNKSFMIFIIGMIFLTPPLTLIIIFVADIYQDNGLSNDDVSLGLFLLSVMSIVGRLLPGIFLQFKRISPLVLPSLNAVFTAILIFFSVFVKSRWLIIVSTGAIGIPMGSFASMTTVVTLTLVGSDTLPIALGLFLTLNGIGQVISGPVNGYIRDVTGSYTAIFYIGTGISLVGAVVFYVAYIMRRKEKHDIQRHSSVFYLTSF